jgi:hypothetical protein
LITLSWVTAYHSFGGEVEAFEHPHDTPPPYPFIPSPTFAHSSFENRIFHYHTSQSAARLVNVRGR